MWTDVKKKLAIVIIGLVILTNFSPNSIAKKELSSKSNEYIYTNDKLDIDYIYNITKALSHIIFTAYNESNGEIAKGRAYGTKGEHKAAEILYENMTKLGLYTYKEQIKNTEKYPELTHELEIVDYYVKINNKTVDSYIAPVWIKNEENDYNLNYTYNYSNLKVIDSFLNFFKDIKALSSDDKIEPFVVILPDKGFCPNSTLNFLPFYDHFIFNYYVITNMRSLINILYTWMWNRYSDYCKGFIFYDFNTDTYDMKLRKEFNHMPFININGSNGQKILEDIENTSIDFMLKQSLNTSTISYNVIGQINGTDQSKTVLIDCLYDSWWCQGTADAAIGMAIVLGVAKYFKEHNITPKYNIKFIGFSGEEHGFCAGSKCYESAHPEENIIYIIDLNQIGFRQDTPKLTLNIIGNKIGFLNEIWQISKQADYANRVNSSKDIRPVYRRDGGPSNSQPFAKSRINCKTVCFLKDSGWKLHHRDGLNHTEGDVLKYFDPEDVNVTGEIVLNVVKYLATDW